MPLSRLFPTSAVRVQRPGSQVLFAAIDQGSSSTKMLVLRRETSGHLSMVADTKMPTGLGKGLAIGNDLLPTHQDVAIKALKTLIAHAATLGISASDISLVSTAAVRNSANGAVFMQRVAGLGLNKSLVLSGAEEAALGYRGAVARIAKDGMRLASIDSGGGSFQVAIGTGHVFEQGGSTQIGSHFVMANFLPARMLTASDFSAADTALDKLAPMPLEPQLLRGRTLVATGGVSRSLRANLGVDSISRAELDAFRRKLGGLEPSARVTFLQHLEAKVSGKSKAAGVAPGAQTNGLKLPSSTTLMLRIMRGLNVDSVQLSATDARHALLREAARVSRP